MLNWLGLECQGGLTDKVARADPKLAVASGAQRKAAVGGGRRIAGLLSHTRRNSSHFKQGCEPRQRARGHLGTHASENPIPCREVGTRRRFLRPCARNAGCPSRVPPASRRARLSTCSTTSNESNSCWPSISHSRVRGADRRDAGGRSEASACSRSASAPEARRQLCRCRQPETPALRLRVATKENLCRRHYQMRLTDVIPVLESNLCMTERSSQHR